MKISSSCHNSPIKKKIVFYIESVDNLRPDMFFIDFKLFIQENKLTINESLLDVIKEHLNNLLQNLNLYFPKDVQEPIVVKTSSS